MNIVEYDSDVDAAWLKFAKGECIDAESIGRVILHYDQDDTVIAVEVLGVTNLDADDWQLLTERIPEEEGDRLKEFHARL